MCYELRQFLCKKKLVKADKSIYRIHYAAFTVAVVASLVVAAKVVAISLPP